MTLRDAYNSPTELFAHLLAGALAAPLVWFVIGPAWVGAIDRLAGMLP